MLLTLLISLFQHFPSLGVSRLVLDEERVLIFDVDGQLAF
jgi:hypothetical protein